MKNNFFWIFSIFAIITILTQIAVITTQQTKLDLSKSKSLILKNQIDKLNKDIEVLLMYVPAEEPDPDKKPPPKGKTFQDGRWHGDYWHDMSE